jgi:hypothetical protein
MHPTDLYINHQLQSEDLLVNRTEYHNTFRCRCVSDGLCFLLLRFAVLRPMLCRDWWDPFRFSEALIWRGHLAFLRLWFGGPILAFAETLAWFRLS